MAVAIASGNGWQSTGTQFVSNTQHTFAVDVTAGSLLVAFVLYLQNVEQTVSDNVNGGWTKGGEFWDATLAMQLGWYYLPNAAAGATTVTASGESGYAEVRVLSVCEYTGAETVSPVDGTWTSAAGSSSGPAPGAITTTGAGVVIGARRSTGAPASTPGTGYTERLDAYGYSGAYAIAIEDRITTAGGAYDPSWTDTAGFWAAIGFAFKAGGATVVGLTGQSVSTSAGALGKTLDRTLSGQSVTASAGTLSPSVAYTAALTGSAVTASAGTLTPSVAVSVGLTGSQTTTAAGALAPSLSVALAGAAATVSAGTVDPSQATTAALTGSAATAAAGTLSPTIAKTLSGQSVAASAGTVAPSVAISVALTGASVTASAGTLTPTQDTVADLAGSAVTTAAGTLGVTHSVALSGATVTAAAGTVAAQASYTASLSGAAVTATAGTLSPATSVALAGEAVAVSAGDVAASVVGDVTIALSGAAVSVLAGTITPQGATVGLHGRPLKRKRLTRKRLPDDYGEPQVAPAAIEPAHAVQSAPPRAQPTSADYAAAAAAIGATRAEIRALRQRSPIDAEIAELMAARLREEAAAELARLREQQEIDNAALALILAIAV